MIKNERQYRITKGQVQKFEQALANLESYSAEQKNENVLLWEAQRTAIESQLNDLKAELEEYEALVDSPNNATLLLESIEEFPLALVKARIAAKLSQKELAERLGLKEQQIQRYEATEYASASFARMLEVSQAVGLKLQLLDPH